MNAILVRANRLLNNLLKHICQFIKKVVCNLLLLVFQN